jgi:uncharacterized linocin/CFP29 family protein
LGWIFLVNFPTNPPPSESARWLGTESGNSWRPATIFGGNHRFWLARYLGIIAGVLFAAGNPLDAEEWAYLSDTVALVGGSTLARRLLRSTFPLGAGVQTVPITSTVGITDGTRSILGSESELIFSKPRASGVVPIISKDFVMHWRDIAESRVMRRRFSVAKAGAAASFCARSEDKLVLSGHSALRYEGLMTVEGRRTMGLPRWERPGSAFDNFTAIVSTLARSGYKGPFASVVHPHIYADMHRLFDGSSSLEIDHVKALLSGGIARSSLLAPSSGVVFSTARQDIELLVSFDTSVAFLGSRAMNLHFRVLKAVYLRILNPGAVCTF